MTPFYLRNLLKAANVTPNPVKRRFNTYGEHGLEQLSVCCVTAVQRVHIMCRALLVGPYK